MNNSLYFFVIILMVSCHSDSSVDKKILEEANNVHSEIVIKKADFESRLVSAIQNVQNEIETAESLEDTITLLDKINVLSELESVQTIYNDWNDNLIEVPGFEKEHVHTKNCNHDHGHDHLNELKVEDHLDIQKDLNKELDRIINEGNQVLDK